MERQAQKVASDERLVASTNVAVGEQPRAALVLLESEGIENNNNQTGDVSEQPTALVLPESEGIENNNHQIGDVSMLDDGSESEKEIHPINTKLLQDVMRNFRQQIRQFDPSRSPSEKWSHLVQWFDITDMRLRFAHSSVSRTFRQPPHNGYKLTELVDSFLHGDERPENMPPLVPGLNICFFPTWHWMIHDDPKSQVINDLSLGQNH